MANRFMEYIKYGAGRPPGTMWSIEKSYFEWKHKYPDKTEYAYLRLALQSRYPLNKDIPEIAARCRNLDDAIMEAVRLDFGDFVAQMFKPALEAFPLCSVCGRYRALNTVDTLCYGCRIFADLVACHSCRLYWQNDAKFCQKCGAPLSPAPSTNDKGVGQAEAGGLGTDALVSEYGPQSRQEGAPTNRAKNLEELFHPAFDFTVEDLFRFGITFFVTRRWEKLVRSEEQSKDCVMTVVRQMHQANVKSRDLIKQFYFPLQLLLMARGRKEFSAIQQEPAFSKTGQRNFSKLFDAYAVGGQAAFDEEWRQIQRLSVESTENRQEIVTYTGGPGLTKENAVLLRGAGAETTVLGEYWYLAYTFGRMGVEWKPMMQALIKRDEAGKVYDVLEVEFADGRRNRFYFDISHLPC